MNLKPIDNMWWIAPCVIVVAVLLALNVNQPARSDDFRRVRSEMIPADKKLEIAAQIYIARNGHTLDEADQAWKTADYLILKWRAEQ